MSPKKQSKGAKKAGKVMREFEAGDLKSGSGKKVTNPDQAKAIASSEARRVSGGGDKGKR